jgi:HK97 gp10 family phage protein
MPLPLAMLARAAASGGGSSSVSGKIGHVEDMTATYLSDAKGALEKAIMKGGVIVQRETKILLNKNKGKATGRNRATGRFQKSAKSRSKAGEVPFKQTGTLARSIQVEGARTGWGEFIARVGATAPADKYGKALELGTENMAPRPYLRPAFDNKQKEIIAVIQAGIKEVSKGGA